MGLLCPPLPGKVIKLFFSTLPTIFMSPRFDLAPVYREMSFQHQLCANVYVFHFFYFPKKESLREDSCDLILL